MKKKIKNKELVKCQKLCKEHLNGWKRERAAFENFRKRTEKRNLGLIKFANEELLLKILPVLDNFEEALRHTPKGWDKAAWTQGIRQIQKYFKDILGSSGLTEVKVKRGDKFDPCLCEALEKQGKSKKECKIVEILQKGYELNGKVVRPAKVKVD